MAKKSLRDIGREHAEKKRARTASHDALCEQARGKLRCECDERAWARYDRSMEGDR